MTKPLVTVIVTHHLNENQKYLDLCLESIQRQYVPKEVIVLSSAKEPTKVPEGVKLVQDPKRLYNSTLKVQAGVAMASPESKYLLLISDDVVLGKDALQNFLDHIGEAQAIFGPISNNDLGSRFMTLMQVVDRSGRSLRLRPSHTFEEMEGFEESLLSYPGFTKGSAPCLFLQDWLCFYCIFMPKSVWERVGELDPILDTRHNDQDYCYRAAKLGIPCFIDTGAFAFHFGTVTLSKDDANRGEQEKASQHFARKWSIVR